MTHSHRRVLNCGQWGYSTIKSEVQMKMWFNRTEIGIYALAGWSYVSCNAVLQCIGGQMATLEMLEVPRIKYIIHRMLRTIKFALVKNPTRVHGRGMIQPKCRIGRRKAVYRIWFNEAIRIYKKLGRVNHILHLLQKGIPANFTKIQ